MSEQKQYMLMFSLGPVQTFIAQARKTRDLWLGSFLLSMMMEAAMKGLENKLVYPADPTIKGDISNLPNKFVALFNKDEKDKALEEAQNSEERIRTLWNTIRNEVWDAIIKGIDTSENEKTTKEKIWDNQSRPDKFFEMFWVIAEKLPDELYKTWFARAQEALDARKRFRNFERQDELGEKSTISGEREALRGPGYSREEVIAFWKQIARRTSSSGDPFFSSKDINQDGAERLDAIDTIKRFAIYSPMVRKKLHNAAFPSTSSVATATFVEALLQDDEAMTAVENWLGVIKDYGMDVMRPNMIPLLPSLAHKYSRSNDLLRCDGDIYFPETFTPKRLKEDYNINDTQKAEVAVLQGRSALTKLLIATDKRSITRPTPYYAFIEMDGDKMGDILKKVENQEEHRNVSTALSVFSLREVPLKVERQYPGRLVYSGGDDVVALAPLTRNYKQDQQQRPVMRTVLDLADQLQWEYCKAVKAPIHSEENKKLVTASTGVAIAHHLTSLSYVRRSAKQAEERAKRHYGRNTLVVTLLRRSGEQTQVGCRWHYDELSDEGQPIPLFTEFYELFKEDMLSPKCVYMLLEETPALVELEKAAQQSEIRRVLLRQLSEKGKASKDRIPILAEYLASLAEEMDKDKQPELRGTEKSIELHVEERRYGLVEVLGWLLVMVFLARKELE